MPMTALPLAPHLDLCPDHRPYPPPWPMPLSLTPPCPPPSPLILTYSPIAAPIPPPWPMPLSPTPPCPHTPPLILTYAPITAPTPPPPLTLTYDPISAPPPDLDTQAHPGHPTRPAGGGAVAWPLLMMITRLVKNGMKRRRILPLLLLLQPLRPHLAAAAVVVCLPACWARCVVAGFRAAWASPWHVCVSDTLAVAGLAGCSRAGGL